MNTYFSKYWEDIYYDISQESEPISTYIAVEVLDGQGLKEVFCSSICIKVNLTGYRR